MRPISPTPEPIANPARRAWLIRAFTTAVAGGYAVRLAWAGDAAEPAPAVRIEQFDASGKSSGFKMLPKVVKSDADWRHQLSPEAYLVTRRAGTERAFTGRYASNHADGLYRCICCDTA